MVSRMKIYLLLTLCIFQLSNAYAFDNLEFVLSISDRAEGYLVVINKKSCIVRNFCCQKESQSEYFNKDIFDWGGDTIILKGNKKIVAKKFMRTNGGNPLNKEVQIKRKDRRTLENLVKAVKNCPIRVEDRYCTDLWIYKLYIDNLLICSGYETYAHQQSDSLGKLLSFIRRLAGIENLSPLT